MTEQAPAPAAVNEEITSLYDFSRFNKIVVLGGGHAGLITAILKENPQAFGVLFDAEQVISGARPKLEAAGVADRCAAIAGDFFESVPAGGDAYIMNWIIPDWDDEKATRILKNIRSQIPQNGRVIIVDCGKERTAREFDRLLTAAGSGFSVSPPQAFPHVWRPAFSKLNPPGPPAQTT